MQLWTLKSLKQTGHNNRVMSMCNKRSQEKKGFLYSVNEMLRIVQQDSM